MIFVNVSGDAPAFDVHIAPLCKRLEPLVGVGGLGELRTAGCDARITVELRCNWKLAVENYCESYHLPWVHRGLNSYSRIQDHYNIVADDWGAGQGSRVFEFSERAGISLPRFAHWPTDKLKVAEYIAVFPNLLIGVQNDHFFAIVLEPVAADRTLETIQLYIVGETPEASLDGQIRLLLDGWREVFMEDVGVCGRHAAGSRLAGIRWRLVFSRARRANTSLPQVGGQSTSLGRFEGSRQVLRPYAGKHKVLRTNDSPGGLQRLASDT